MSAKTKSAAEKKQTKTKEVDSKKEEVKGAEKEALESTETPKATQESEKEKESTGGAKNSPKPKGTDKESAENQKAHDKNLSLKAHYYSRAIGGSLSRITGKKPTVKDLLDRNYPSGTTQDSEFLLDGGKVFSVRENAITNQDESSLLKLLNKQK